MKVRLMNLPVKDFKCKKSRPCSNWSVFGDRRFDLSEKRKLLLRFRVG